MSDTKKFQVNFKTPTGALINIYADTYTDLAFQLAEIGKLAAEIATTEQLIFGASNAASLAVPHDPPPQAAPEPQGEVLQFPQQQQQAPGPGCMHGARVYRSGISKKTGKAYSGWYCPQNQCDVQWGG